MNNPQSTQLVPVERVEKLIVLLRGEKVLLGQHLAELYGVPVKVLIQAVKRNRSRFPEDFMFQSLPRGVRELEVTICDFKLGRLSRQGSQHALPREEKVTRPIDPDWPSGEHDGLYQIMRSDPLYRA